MRFSTVAFMLIFAGLFGHTRREHKAHTHNAPQPAVTTTQLSPRHAHLVAEMNRRIESVDHSARQVDQSVHALEKTLRSLQDHIRKAEKELCRCDSALCRQVYQIREQSIARMKDELNEVVEGHRMLLAEKENLQVQRIALKAKRQLAEAGIDLEEDTADVAPQLRPSPLDALAKTR